MSSYATLVGSRTVPLEFHLPMRRISAYLEQAGFTSRSGAAPGSDSLFEQGIRDPYKKEIYIPWDGFSNRYTTEIGVICKAPWNPVYVEAERLALQVHPNPILLKSPFKQAVLKLHTRNAFQVLGSELNQPSTLLVCYAEPQGDSVKGGTRTAVEIARMYGIPVYNIWYPEILTQLLRRIDNGK